MSVDAKDARRVGMKGAVGGAIGDRGATFKIGIDADERLGPEPVAGVDLLDLRPDIVGTDLRERTRKPLVVAHERTIQIENIHCSTPYPNSINGPRCLHA